MPVLASKGNAPAFGLGFSTLTTITEELGGLVLVTPTSISYTGTSATINPNGSITATTITELTVNGVFSSEYNNYLITCLHKTNTYTDMSGYFTSSGTPNTTENSYTRQYINATGSTIFAGRASTNYINQFFVTAGNYGGDMAFVYGPYLPSATAVRTNGASDWQSAEIYDRTYTHNVAQSFDGIRLVTNGSFDLAIYGLVGS